MLPTFRESLENVKNEIYNLGVNLLKSNEIILQSLKECDKEKFEEAKKFLKNISNKSNDIDNEIIKILALYSPEARDLRRVVAYLKIVHEFSRAYSNTRNFIRGFSDLCDDLDLQTINEYAIPMQTSTINALKTSVNMINVEDVDELQDMYEEVLIEESKADDLYEMIERNLIAQAESASTNFEKFHKMLRALRKGEKIANRAISIASLLLYIEVGGNLNS